MKTIGNELFAQYDMSIKKVQYNRSNYYLDTKQGSLMLRKTIVPKDQICFQYEVTQQLLHKGFTEIAKIYLTKKQNPYGLYQDRYYILQSYNKTIEIDFTSEKDLKAVIEVLAKFHKVAKNIESKTRDVENASIKNIYEYFQKRVVDGKHMRKKISNFSQKTKFEIMFLNDYKVYEALQYMALDLITPQIAAELINKVRLEKTLIHNDYTYHAVGQIEGSDCYMINNLDTCTYNIQLIDLANVLTKIMQKNNWNIALLDKLIASYNAIHTLSYNEINVLKAMLIFPEKYAGICYKYTNSKHRNNYSMFEHKWENMLVYKEAQFLTAKELAKEL